MIPYTRLPPFGLWPTVPLDALDTVIEPPACELLGLDEVKVQRRFPSTTLDSLFVIWIAASRQWFEEYTGRQTITCTRERWLSTFPAQPIIELPYPPLQQVLSITYGPEGVDEITLDPTTYDVLAPAGERATRGRVVLKSGTSWPTVTPAAKAVRVRYVCGYGDAPGDVPDIVKAALFWLVGHFHKYGEAVNEGLHANALQELPLGVNVIFDGLKYSALPTARRSVAAMGMSTWG
jgi:uncharacterized phiE125 gp8 family phage protein